MPRKHKVKRVKLSKLPQRSLNLVQAFEYAAQDKQMMGGKDPLDWSAITETYNRTKQHLLDHLLFLHNHQHITKRVKRDELRHDEKKLQE